MKRTNALRKRKLPPLYRAKTTFVFFCENKAGKKRGKGRKLLGKGGQVVLIPYSRDDFGWYTECSRVNFFKFVVDEIQKKKLAPLPPQFISGNPEIKLIADRLLGISEILSI